MIRTALPNSFVPLAAAPWVERAESRQNGLDRALLHGWGLACAVASPLRRLRLRWFARRVLAQDERLRGLGMEQLALEAQGLRDGLRTTGLAERRVIDAFALVREVAGRMLGKRHFAVQLMGGRVILEGGIAEMSTGEGKTLTALLPAVTMGLAGIPVHVVTVNEYLAARDAADMEPVYRFFGLSVGRVLPGQQRTQRAHAYRADVAYCVNKDLAFDYLRDRIEALRGTLGPRAAVAQMLDGIAAPPSLTRGLWYAIVDEADSVFIDEARTPLIISETRPGGPLDTLFDAALALSRGLHAGQHYLLREREHRALLTQEGRDMALKSADPALPNAEVERARLVEQALCALHCYQRDRHYIVEDGKIQIVDEYTGRVMPDRSWESGLHQMIERKEALDLTAGRHTTARITYQRMFRRYLRVGGMSGTVAEAAGELKALLGLGVLRIGTHHPTRRVDFGTQLFARSADRDAAVVQAVLRQVGLGRAVLVGTRSVAASERLSALLAAVGVGHQVLNAKQNAEEAAVIGRAGRPGSVTVATNMAGRGTDIELEPAVRKAGGLHVVLTEFHESRRIDRQLYGRCGRQGDPGSHESLVALDDELFVLHALQLSGLLASRARRDALGRLPGWCARLLRHWAQFRAEAHHADVRRQTLRRERDNDRLLAFAGAAE